ncbi:uncharacterized protein LOC144599098 [Rhinoraja longicauda]
MTIKQQKICKISGAKKPSRAILLAQLLTFSGNKRHAKREFAPIGKTAVYSLPQADIWLALEQPHVVVKKHQKVHHDDFTIMAAAAALTEARGLLFLLLSAAAAPARPGPAQPGSPRRRLALEAQAPAGGQEAGGECPSSAGAGGDANVSQSVRQCTMFPCCVVLLQVGMPLFYLGHTTIKHCCLLTLDCWKLGLVGHPTEHSLTTMSTAEGPPNPMSVERKRKREHLEEPTLSQGDV